MKIKATVYWMCDHIIKETCYTDVVAITEKYDNAADAPETMICFKEDERGCIVTTTYYQYEIVQIALSVEE